MVYIYHVGNFSLVNLFLFVCVCVFRHLLLQPLRVNGVKVYTENVDKRQVIMDLQIRYAANPAHTQTQSQPQVLAILYTVL